MPKAQFNLRAMFLFVVMAAIGAEGLRRWLIDPASSRLPAGSGAMLDRDHPGFLCVYPFFGAAPVKVRFGSRVKVISDTRPKNQQTYLCKPDGTLTAGDDREVTILVLDGDKAGVRGITSRFYLRPVQ